MATASEARADTEFVAERMRLVRAMLYARTVDGAQPGEVDVVADTAAATGVLKARGAE